MCVCVCGVCVCLCVCVCVCVCVNHARQNTRIGYQLRTTAAVQEKINYTIITLITPACSQLQSETARNATKQ